MKRLIIYDLDGTLVNTTDVNYNAYNEALKEIGSTVSYEYFRDFCNGRHYSVFLPVILDNDNEKIEYVHQRKKELYSKYLNLAKPNAHLIKMLQLKEDYYFAIVTTASEKNTREMLEFLGIYEEFDLILTKENVKKAKPDPEGFLKAMEFLGVTPENTIIYEDSDVGIEAAVNSGAGMIMRCM